jgi:hypothetical protein
VPVPQPWKLKVVKSCRLAFQSSRRKVTPASVITFVETSPK